MKTHYEIDRVECGCGEVYANNRFLKLHINNKKDTAMKDFFVYEVKTNNITFYVGRASRISNVEHRIEKFKENVGSVPIKQRGIQRFKKLEKQIQKVLDKGGEVIYKKVFESNDYLKCIQKEKEIIQELIEGLKS